MKKNLFFISLFVVFSIVLKAQNFDTVKTLFINKSFTPKLQQTKDSQTNNQVNPNVVCGGTDKRVLPSSNPQSEVHISIDKTNTNNILASANTFTTNYNQGYYYTTNGGSTWSGADQLSGSTVLYGDPSTAYDASGNAFISSMIPNLTAQDADGYYLQKSTNKGVTWGNLIRGSDTRLNFDKDMIGADNYSSSPYKNYVYAAWTDFTGNSSVRFNRTTNGGTSFSTPITLKNSNGFGQGANVQTGPNGEVYVCWADYTNGTIPAQGIGFVKSTNGGVSFTAPTVPIHYVGIRTYAGGDPAFNYTRVNDFPSMAVDKSNFHKGRIYIVFAAKENGNGKAVVQICWSDNGGSTFTTPKTISISNGRQNWFPWIAVDDANGYIYVDYYSLDQATGFSTNTYVAYSKDGGSTFQNQIVSDVAHTTQAINNTIFANGYAGDYIGMTAYNNKAYAAWMDERSGTWQIYVSQVSDVDIAGNSWFCTSSSYSISNLPVGATVNWSVSPSGIANKSCTSCTQTTLSKASVGVVTLTATISNACGSTSLVLNKNVSVGFAPITLSSTPTGSCSGAYETWYESVNPYTNGSNWHWTVDYLGNNSDIYINNPYTSSTYVDVKGGGTLKLTYTDVCGNNDSDGVTLYSHCYNNHTASFSIIPNPANSYVRIETSFDAKGSSSKNLIYVIRIIDGFGNQRKLLEYKSGILSTTISVSDLKPGIYLVSVYDGYTWSGKSLVIQK
jgi:hypothetical protein